VVLGRDGIAGLLIVSLLFVSLSLSMGRLQGFLVAHGVFDKGILCLRLSLCLVIEAFSPDDIFNSG